MRLKVIIGFIVFVILLLLGRVYYLSIISNEHFEKLSQKNYIKKIHNAASRGSILDRNGNYLAVNRVGFSINIKPHLRNKNEFKNVEEVASLIVKYFPKFKYKKLIKKYKQLDSPYRHDLVKVVDYIAYDEFFKFYTIFNSNENVEIKSSTIREYLYNDVGDHVISKKMQRVNITILQGEVE
jgi:penicillin-binding protein 2